MTWNLGSSHNVRFGGNVMSSFLGVAHLKGCQIFNFYLDPSPRDWTLTPYDMCLLMEILIN
jgi:hypothetical protein